jgi:ABC-type bacteriocin/lantibiotic exporter with double-glycine peptidase domain
LSRKRIFAPEVVQTSSLDCGPAALKCLLEGFGRHVSYGRLREACQTGIDGTSIDAIETVANQLGLEAEQVMLPADHLFLGESHALPALVVIKLPIGLTHFVVVWRRHGRMLQVMDPGTGRRWVRLAELAHDVYQHTIAVDAAGWRDFAASAEFQGALRARLRALHLSAGKIDALAGKALDDAGWRGLARLDAAARMAATAAPDGGLRKGTECAGLIARYCEQPESIPTAYWSVRPAPENTESGEQLLMRGAVLLRVRGIRSEIDAAALSPELAAAITERPASPARELLSFAYNSRGLFAFVLLIAGAAAAGAIAVEALLFQGLFDAASGRRLAVLLGILLLLFVLEIPALVCALRLGRRIEMRFRNVFLEKLPKLADRYFRSRLISDMAERSHLVHRLRNLAPLAYQLLRTCLEIVATALAIIWLDPSAAPIIVGILAAGFILLFFALPVLNERDLRLRTHTGALTRFYLDAMLGLTAIRAHSAESSMQSEHAKLLVEWRRAARRFHGAASAFEAIQLSVTFALVVGLILTHSFAANGAGLLLLAAYWALSLPSLAQDFGALARQYPHYRNLTLRLLEPLGAPEEKHSASPSALDAAPSIAFQNVSVEVSGHTILEEIDFSVAAGEHVAIVGPSGAGKSSLAGVLLGWLQPSRGSVLVNGGALDCETLRVHTAWVDPAVQIWNRSLFANLAYGSDADASSVARVAGTALLRRVLSKLPRGFDTRLGEGGGLLSGGEAQRVRFGRALVRGGIQLVILDEPFRGLDRAQRRALLARARRIWGNCTLLCITHDIAETQNFDRVLVVEAGRIVEQGNPAELRARHGSPYADLLESEAHAQRLWSAGFWRRVQVHSGRIVERAPAAVAEEAEIEVL